VAGYLVNRYDPATLVVQAITTDCAGIVTATS
jgi:hypothetical protein